MSRRTRFIILAGIILFAASCLYPPWVGVYDNRFPLPLGALRAYAPVPCGWGPLWRSTDATVDLPLLAIEWALIAAVTSGTVLLAARRRDVGAANHPEAN